MRYLVAWTLYGCGHAVSLTFRNDWTARLPLYPAYRWLMLASEAVQGGGSGPWNNGDSDHDHDNVP